MGRGSSFTIFRNWFFLVMIEIMDVDKGFGVVCHFSYLFF